MGSRCEDWRRRRQWRAEELLAAGVRRGGIPGKAGWFLDKTPVASFMFPVLSFPGGELFESFRRKSKQERFPGGTVMLGFLLWCILFVVCWPLALLALVLYPFVWVVMLPFRLVGIAVHGALALVWAVVMLPARLLSAPFRLAV